MTRNNRLRKVVAAAMGALTLVVVSACGTSQASSASNELEQIKQNGEIVIGTEGTYAPFTYHDPKTNELTGYDVDVATAVAQELGVKPKFVEANWDSLLAGLDAKKFDTVANEVTPTAEREQKYDFTNEYAHSQGVILTRKGDTSIKQFSDLQGKKAAETLTSNWNKVAQENGAEIVSINDFSQAVDALNAGRADAFVNDRLSVLDYLKNKPDANVQIVATSESAPAATFPVRKGETELTDAINNALAKLQQEGKLKEISVKYFGEDIASK